MRAATQENCKVWRRVPLLACPAVFLAALLGKPGADGHHAQHGRLVVAPDTRSLSTPHFAVLLGSHRHEGAIQAEVV
jgi:hypothetical protein